MKNSTANMWALTLGLALASSANAQGPVGKSFCEDLKAVVADADNDFSHFKGNQIGDREVDSVGDVTIIFAALRSLSGATSCTVEDFKSPTSESPLKGYHCRWAPTGTKSDVVGEVATAARDCVGGSDMDDLKFYQNDIADAYIYGGNYEINIGSGTAPDVFMSIYHE
jgi:hypothetical protein